jgi:hypothetical protein
VVEVELPARSCGGQLLGEGVQVVDRRNIRHRGILERFDGGDGIALEFRWRRGWRSGREGVVVS